MRATQILLSITILFLCTTTEAQETDWDMFTVKNEITELKRRVDLAEEEIKTLKTNWNMFSAKSTGSEVCPCPTGGKCICPADDCDCPNCPEHRNPKATAGNGRTALGFGATWCPPCVGVKRDSEGLAIRWYDVDRDKDMAERYHVTNLPELILIEDGRVVENHTGVFGFLSKAERWLNGEDLPKHTIKDTRRSVSRPVTRIVTRPPPRNDFQPVRISIPPPVVHQGYIPQNRGPGHTHRCGRCGASWSHENWNVGNPAAHTCPSCGMLTYGNRTEGWQASRPVRTRTMPQNTFFQPRVMLSGMGSFCPTCPR